MPEFDDGQAATTPPNSTIVETDVLIVESGPAGASAALLLSSLGIRNTMITKYRWTAHELDVPLNCVVIGPGRAVTDLYYDWAKLREVEESGALLVRPDKHIAWRSYSLPEDPEGSLRDALAGVLGRVAV